MPRSQAAVTLRHLWQDMENSLNNTVTNMGNTFRTQTQRLQREIRATKLQFNRATRLLNQEKAKSQALRQLLTNNGVAIPANLRR